MKIRLLVHSFGSYLKRLREFSTKAETSTLSQRRATYGSIFPAKLLNKKHKTPNSLYLANDNGAQIIMNSLEPFLTDPEIRTDTLLKINPGIGLLTRRILEREDLFPNIILYEGLEYFTTGLLELCPLYGDRIKLIYGDLISLGKLEYQDKLDNGNRVTKFLKDVPTRPFGEEPNVTIIGAVGSYNFFKNLIKALVFQRSLFALGRPEMFLVTTPSIYIHLTCDSEIGYIVYRSTSKLFQMLFEHRFIAKIPRSCFLPTQAEYDPSKAGKLNRLLSIDPDYLYLIKITPRPNLFELCSPADLPALWFFTEQNSLNRHSRIIPNMEKLVPGCGPRLIVNKEAPVPIQRLYPDEDIDKLPKYSKPCTTMSPRDFFPDLNIFTEFGDLSPSNLLTLYSQFRSWPEYSEGSFLASLENSLVKLEAAETSDLTTEAEEITKSITHIVEEREKEQKELEKKVLGEEAFAENNEEEKPEEQKEDETEMINENIKK